MMPVKKITAMWLGAAVAALLAGNVAYTANYEWAGSMQIQRNYEWAAPMTQQRNYEWAAPAVDGAGSIDAPALTDI